MIDLRCHILDGTGCGPDSFIESLEMCKAAIEGGVRTVVATPLWKAGSAEPPIPFDEMSQKIERLRSETDGALNFRSGFTFEFDEKLPELTAKYGARITLGGKRHLLVSVPSTSVPEDASSVWAHLACQGFSVILAHPECNTALRRIPALLSEWSARGVKFQFDAASVAGAYGREIRRFTLKCLQKFQGHTLVASNARSARENLLNKARVELICEVGERRATNYVKNIPMAIINDGEVRPNGKRGSAMTVGVSLFRSLRPLKTSLVTRSHPKTD